MPSSTQIDRLHHQYFVQTQWTKNIRHYLLTLAGANPSSRILEVGCGTGAILRDLMGETKKLIVGIDIDHTAISFAKNHVDLAHLAVADVFHLPFSNEFFDITVCHFFLLWIHNQKTAISEMKRVTKPKGAVIAFAEPDYLSRIDYPDELRIIGKFQNDSLIDKGADLSSGRKLHELFSFAGFNNVHFGILGSLWEPHHQIDEFKFEWDYLNEDLSQNLNQLEVNELKEMDWITRKAGRRVLYIPTFWAIGWV